MTSAFWRRTNSRKTGATSTKCRFRPAFISGSGERGVSVALAYDPPVRTSRRDYLGRTMWIEVMKGLTRDEVIRYRTRYDGPGDAPQTPPVEES